MSPLEALLKSAAIPGVAGGATYLLVALAARRRGPDRPRLRGVGAGFGIAVAFGTGLALLPGWPALPLAAGESAWLWVAWFAAAGLVFGGLEAAFPLPTPAAVPLRFAASLGAMWLLVEPLAANGALTNGDAWTHAGLAAAGATLLWQAGVAGSGTSPARDTASLALLPTVAGLATTLVFVSGAAVMGQSTGALASGLGVVFVLSLGLGRPAVGVAGAAVVALVVGGILLAAYEYLNWEDRVNFPFISGLLLVAGAGFGVVMPLWGPGPRSAVVRLALNVLPPLAGAVLAWLVARAGAPPPFTG